MKTNTSRTLASKLYAFPYGDKTPSGGTAIDPQTKTERPGTVGDMYGLCSSIVRRAARTGQVCVRTRRGIMPKPYRRPVRYLNGDAVQDLVGSLWLAVNHDTLPSEDKVRPRKNPKPGERKYTRSAKYLAFRQDTVNAAGSDYWETRWYMARGEWSGSDRFKPTGGWVEVSAGHATNLVKDGLAVRLTDFGRQSHSEIDSAFARGRTVVFEYKYTPRSWSDAEYTPDSWPFTEDSLSQVWETLTERERDICRMLRNGMTQDTIRESLGITQQSVSAAIGRIGEKYRRMMVG